MPSKVELHPVVTLFPPLTGDAFERLKADIDENGQREPIVFWRNKLVDGRNRLEACRQLNIQPDECELDDDVDPVAYALSANLHRRQLSTSQRALSAAKLAGLENGHRPVPNGTGQSADEASRLFGVGRRSVFRALDVLRDGATELVALCEQGDVSVSLASKLIAKVPAKAKQAKLARQGKAAIADAVREQPAAFDVDTAGDSLEDWLRRTIRRWPDEHRASARHIVSQVLKEEIG